MGAHDGLWTCPRCGRKLVGKNMYHSCSDATVEDFSARAGPQVRAFYARFESMIAACGPYSVSPAKMRIAFMARVRFAGVRSVGERHLDVGVSLPEPLQSARLTQVKEIVPGWWTHQPGVTRLEELDEELQGWLAESYRLMGMQQRSESRRHAQGRRKTPRR